MRKRYEVIRFYPDVLEIYESSSEASQQCLKRLFREILEEKIPMVPLHGYGGLYQVVACAYILMISAREGQLFVLDIKYHPEGEEL